MDSTVSCHRSAAEYVDEQRYLPDAARIIETVWKRRRFIILAWYVAQAAWILASAAWCLKMAVLLGPQAGAKSAPQ
jgi:hypothetical protein